MNIYKAKIKKAYKDLRTKDKGAEIKLILEYVADTFVDWKKSDGADTTELEQSVQTLKNAEVATDVVLAFNKILKQFANINLKNYDSGVQIKYNWCMALAQIVKGE